MHDNAGTIIAAIKQLLSEFEDDEDVLAMLTKLPWVD